MPALTELRSFPGTAEVSVDSWLGFTQLQAKIIGQTLPVGDPTLNS